MENKPILAFDCATSPASVALRVGDRIIRADIQHGSQAAQFVPTIDRLMCDENLSYRDLGCIVTTSGPGSFTGLRIALATLHGLVLAHPTPIRLTTTTVAVALAVAARTDAPHVFTIALDAGKDEVFAQDFSIQNARAIATSEIALHPAAALANFALPTFSNLLAPEHPNNISGPDAAILARYAETIPLAELRDAMPYYIRPADAKISG